MILDNFFSEKNYLDLKKSPNLKQKIKKMVDAENYLIS